MLEVAGISQGLLVPTVRNAEGTCGPMAARTSVQACLAAAPSAAEGRNGSVGVRPSAVLVVICTEEPMGPAACLT